MAVARTEMTKNAGRKAAADGRWDGAVRDPRVMLATVTTGR